MLKSTLTAARMAQLAVWNLQRCVLDSHSRHVAIGLQALAAGWPSPNLEAVLNF